MLTYTAAWNWYSSHEQCDPTPANPAAAISRPHWDVSQVCDGPGVPVGQTAPDRLGRYALEAEH